MIIRKECYEMGPLIFFIIGVIFLIVKFAIRTSNNIQQTNDTINKINKTVEEQSIVISKELNYQLLFVQKIRLIVDESSKNVHIWYLNLPQIIIPFDKLMGCELICNGQTVGGISRALAGGILAGGAGAIVGTLTAQKKSLSITLKIKQNDLQNPEIIMSMIDASVDGDSAKDAKLCQEAIDFANKVIATIDVIIKQTSDGQTDNTISETKSKTEQLTELKNLYENGLITEDEFTTKKRQILGL